MIAQGAYDEVDKYDLKAFVIIINLLARTIRNPLSPEAQDLIGFGLDKA